MKPKKVQAGPKVPCPKCGKPISKRGLNGHQYTCKGPAKPEAPRPASSPGKPSGASGNSTVSFDSMMLKEVGLEQKPDGKIEPAGPTIDELQKKYNIDAKAWGSILWFIGDTLDGFVDEVVKKYPGAIIKKSNLSQSRADHMGDLCYAVFGPCKPETALAAELFACFMPPIIGMLLTVLPREVTVKLFGGMQKMFVIFTSKLRKPEGSPSPTQG